MAAAIYWTPISQNFRYIAPVYGSMYLLGGIGLGVLVSLAERFGKRIAYPTYAALAFLVVLSVNAGYSDFQQIFLAFDVQDLSIHHILEIPTVKQKLLYQ